MCVNEFQRKKNKARRQRRTLELRVLHAAIEWRKNLRRINATTYTDENRLAEVLRSPTELAIASTALLEFEETARLQE